MNKLGLLLLVLVGVGAAAAVGLSSNNENTTGPVLSQYTGGKRKRKTKSNRKKSIKNIKHKK